MNQPPNPPSPPVNDERLARLAARSAERRAQLATSPLPAHSASNSRTRRSHPAKGSRATALAVSIASTVGLTGYFRAALASDVASTADSQSATVASSGATAGADPLSTADTASAATQVTTADASASDTADGSADAAAVQPESTSLEIAASVETPAAVEVVADEASATGSTGLTDGTFIGETFTNKWGPVQVQIAVEGGLIVDVATPQIPDADRKSVSINARAVPQLVTATLASQTADVDTVSGATYTSGGYRQSLQTAIDAARAAVGA